MLQRRNRVNNEINRTTKVGDISKKVQVGRLKWYWHAMRREEECVEKRVMRLNEKEGKTSTQTPPLFTRRDVVPHAPRCVSLINVSTDISNSTHNNLIHKHWPCMRLTRRYTDTYIFCMVAPLEMQYGHLLSSWWIADPHGKWSRTCGGKLVLLCRMSISNIIVSRLNKSNASR